MSSKKTRNARGFTLIEMLVVVAVLVTLMTMVFRLSSIGSDSARRTLTISRLQKLENCLSGYYAAFGTYPPVKVQGSRSIYARVTTHGIQTDERQVLPIADIWNQVEAACKAQPVACQFPFPADYKDLIVSVSNTLRDLANAKEEEFDQLWSSDGGKTEDQSKISKYNNGFDGGSSDRFSSNDTDWRNVQAFRFGLLSYILPRYLFMTEADETYFNGTFSQWEANNSLPCDPLTGERYSSWSTMRQKLLDYRSSGRVSDLAQVANIPSQAVCARWMPNLEGSCTASRDMVFFGVNVRGGGSSILDVANRDIEVFTPNGSDNYADQYILDSITMQDGWGRDFFYYSPAPYQKYVVWSAGPNGKTFPPWIPRKTLNATDAATVGNWTADDITGMSN